MVEAGDTGVLFPPPVCAVKEDLLIRSKNTLFLSLWSLCSEQCFPSSQLPNSSPILWSPLSSILIIKHILFQVPRRVLEKSEKTIPTLKGLCLCNGDAIDHLTGSGSLEAVQLRSPHHHDPGTQPLHGLEDVDGHCKGIVYMYLISRDQAVL